MSEGEIPEIPKHLQESLPSAGKQEEELRRDFQIREAAFDHSIPEASLGNETVQRYVSVMRDVNAASRRDIDPLPPKDTVAYTLMKREKALYVAAGK